MKKITAILLTALMIFAFAACGSETENGAKRKENPEIAELFDRGFSTNMTTFDETRWAGIFIKDDSFDEIYKVVAPMTPELYAELDAIGWEDDEARNAFIRTLSDATVTDVSDLVPAQEALDTYIGYKLQELEDHGFEKTGYSNWEDGCEFSYDGPEFCVRVTPAEKIVDFDDLSENDIRGLTIAKIEFSSISGSVLDN